MTFQEWWKSRKASYGTVEDEGPQTAARDAWAAAVAEEREACARVAEAEEQYRPGNPIRANTGRDIAAAIRARL